jgi:hypothetical protein
VTSKSIEFLRRRDPTKPFFPQSFLSPAAFRRSIRRRRTSRCTKTGICPEPYEGDWTGFVSNYAQPENPVPSEPYDIDRARRAYCALVTQSTTSSTGCSSRSATSISGTTHSILLVSDHGRHALRSPSGAQVDAARRLCRDSAPVPAAPFDAAGAAGRDRREARELRDIFPTVCDLCGVDIPADSTARASSRTRSDATTSTANTPTANSPTSG